MLVIDKKNFRARASETCLSNSERVQFKETVLKFKEADKIGKRNIDQNSRELRNRTGGTIPGISDFLSFLLLLF